MNTGESPIRVVMGDPDATVVVTVAEALGHAGFIVQAAASAEEVVSAIYSDPPHCIVVPLEWAGTRQEGLIHDLKADNLYGHLPVVLTIPREVLSSPGWQSLLIDDYVLRPCDGATLAPRIRICIERSRRDVDTNPLSGLPGNLAIMREAGRRLGNGEAFAFAYLDLDNFKPYNDKYGFSRGDEVLRMTARIVVNVIREIDAAASYVGHVGGDDFVFLLPGAKAEAACTGIIQNFDRIVPSFYDDEDRRRGNIESRDRQGNLQTFPLITCSIAVVDMAVSKVTHVGELSVRAADIKRYVKKLSGSQYLVDRRA